MFENDFSSRFILSKILRLCFQLSECYDQICSVTEKVTKMKLQGNQ